VLAFTDRRSAATLPSLMATELVAPALLEILRCPRCRGELRVAAADLECPSCRLGFAVVDGVPNFLLEDARPLGSREAR
jgi:uncharacterized protein YbaR (Trm112 family)